MAKFVFDPERQIMVNKETGEPMNPGGPLQTPMVIGDIPAYRSPVTGQWVEGRRARRYDLEKHNCVDANDFAPKEPRKLKNPKFAKKHGLERMLER